MSRNQQTGILLLNLGGPATLDDVEPFLVNLFSDRQIIRLGPPFLQKPLARLIAWRRAPKSRESYRKIGGGSPIGCLTTSQAAALEKALEKDGRFIVRVCMRYWKPFAEEAVREMQEMGIREIIALPLYPHYSVATSGSSFADLHRVVKKIDPALSLIEIRSWPDQPHYIASLRQRIEEGLASFGAQTPEIVYSAHSLPRKFIDEGDPYVRELERTISALEREAGIRGRLCYQSRSGPVEWLAPSTPETLQQLAATGCKNILMVPISFVSDHVETLYEIDMLYREMAGNLGMRLESTRALNDDPLFITALRSLVLEKV